MPYSQFLDRSIFGMLLLCLSQSPTTPWNNRKMSRTLSLYLNLTNLNVLWINLEATVSGDSKNRSIMIQFQDSLKTREWGFYFFISLLMSKLIRFYMAVIIKQIGTLGKSLTYLVALSKSIIRASFHICGRQLSQALLSTITVPQLHLWGSIAIWIDECKCTFLQLISAPCVLGHENVWRWLFSWKCHRHAFISNGLYFTLVL